MLVAESVFWLNKQVKSAWIGYEIFHYFCYKWCTICDLWSWWINISKVRGVVWAWCCHITRGTVLQQVAIHNWWCVFVLHIVAFFGLSSHLKSTVMIDFENHKICFQCNYWCLVMNKLDFMLITELQFENYRGFQIKNWENLCHNFWK